MTVTVIKKGTFPNSAAEQMEYWLKRPQSERIQALFELRESTHRMLRGGPLPSLSRAVRVIKRKK